MKTRIVNMLTFFLMVMVLGTQTLLHGSWTIKKTENASSNSKTRN
ncbi:hypothetical protein [Aurantibacter sp.]